MFRLEFLPAQQGDAIWIEYGAPDAVHRILIDAGTPATAPLLCQRIEALDPSNRHFDLLVVTHVDTDHIGGVLKLLSRLPAGLQFDDVWFNGWPQIRKARSSRLGPIDGEILSVALRKLEWPWNQHFHDQAVMVPKSGAPPEKKLRGGMRLTVLSPGDAQLADLRDEWKTVVKDAGLDPKTKDGWRKLLEKAARKGVTSSILGEPKVSTLARSKFEPDDTVANGSSIALLAEYDGKSALLTGDAYAPVLLEAINRLCKARRTSRLKVDVLKLPHHGSRGNVNKELLAKVPAHTYVVSTSGAVFGHPDDEAIARVLTAPTRWTKTVYFNYTSATIAKNYEKRKKRKPPKYDKTGLRRQFNCDVKYAENDKAGVVLMLRTPVERKGGRRRSEEAT